MDNPDNLAAILKLMSGLESNVVFPVHQRTMNTFRDYNIVLPGNIQITVPVVYLDFLNLKSRSQRVFTDSGGIQKEAYSLKKPCRALRTETERLETVETGWNMLVNYHDSDAGELVRNFSSPAEHPELFENDVGEGMAGLIRNGATGKMMTESDYRNERNVPILLDKY